MTLFELLAVTSFTSPIGCAMVVAWRAHSSVFGYAVALLLSMLLGFACVWVIEASAERVFPVLSKQSTFGMKLYLITYICALTLWPFFAGFLGSWVASSVVRLLA